VLSLENADQIRAALPLGGAGIAATFESEASTGMKFDLGLVIAGQLVGSASTFSAAELGGDCAGATHVITAGKLGAFAMGTSSKAELSTAAEVFGAGVSAGSASSKLTKARDGSIEACEKAGPDNNEAPRQCDALLALELSKLTEGLVVEVDMLFGLVFGLEACTDFAECEAACNAGKGKGCKELAIADRGHRRRGPEHPSRRGAPQQGLPPRRHALVLGPLQHVPLRAALRRGAGGGAEGV
jgi:hypothetical protein